MMDIICDLDGTLCDDGHRSHHMADGKKDYDNYHGLCHNDKPHEAVLRIIKSMADEGHRIRIFTGRPEEWRLTTVKWLLLNRIPYADLHMRASNDRRPTEVVKEEMFRNHCSRPVLFVLEDRAKVVAMWRRIGLICFQVAQGDF